MLSRFLRLLRLLVRFNIAVWLSDSCLVALSSASFSAMLFATPPLSRSGIARSRYLRGIGVLGVIDVVEIRGLSDDGTSLRLGKADDIGLPPTSSGDAV